MASVSSFSSLPEVGRGKSKMEGLHDAIVELREDAQATEGT